MLDMASRAQRGDQRIQRRALWSKIELLRHRTPGIDAHSAGTWGAFSAFTGVSRETLRDGCPRGDGGTFLYESLTEHTEAILGQKYGFDPACKTWTHGTAAEWAAKWFSEPSENSAPRLVAIRVDERVRSIDPEQRLSVALFMRLQEANPGNQVFDGELVCQVFTRVGVRLAVRRGMLKVICREDLVPPMAARLGGEDGAARFERKANTITLTPGGQDHMHWGIESDRAPIGVVSQQLVQLFRVRGLRDGDVFDVSFVVEDGDLLADEARETGSAVETVPDDGVADSAVVAASGVPLSTNKRQLMAHIAKHSLDLFGRQRAGTAVLCSYAVRIEAEKPEEKQGGTL